MPNIGYVRSGFSYFPQLVGTESVSTAAGAKDVPIVHDRAAAAPESAWVGVSPIKRTQVDIKHSMVVDVIFNSTTEISHRAGKNAAGLNACFPDGHVVWQNAKRVPAAFNNTVWGLIAGGSVNDLRYVQSLWQQ